MRVTIKRLGYRLASPLAHAWWGLWRSHHDGVKCVLTNAGDVLLVRHTYGDRRRWAFPGGLVRRGEAPIAAAAREMDEELGLVLDAGELRHVGALAPDSGRRRDTTHYFQLELVDRAVAPDPVELAEVAWFASAALPRPVDEHVAQALAWVASSTRDPARGAGRAGIASPVASAARRRGPHRHGSPCVSIDGNRSGEPRPGLRGRRGADPQT